MLSFAIVFAGSFDGNRFRRPVSYDRVLYKELQPISQTFQNEALRVNRLDRDRLIAEGVAPAKAMADACEWVKQAAGAGSPVLVAYPLSFDWTWLYWYFTNFCPAGSPFGYSRCFDIKTALSVKAGLPISEASRSRIRASLLPRHKHTHHAVDDAIAQAEIFANVFEWEGVRERTP